jgi:hypothetical protein
VKNDKTAELNNVASVVSLDSSDDVFNFEKHPKMVIMVPAKAPRATTLVHHVDASASIKKTLFDRAKLQWKDLLDKVPANQVLALAQQTQSQIEEKLLQKLISEQGFNTGEQYEDKQCKITYKTFLKKEQ